MNFLLDFGRQNGRPEALKLEPKLDQGPPKKHSKNMTEKETEKGAKLGPKMGQINLTRGMRGARGELKSREFEKIRNEIHTRCLPFGWRRIQSLRAFRRAEVIFDAVLFESCVDEVAVAMTVASIFYFEFWFLWGVR